MDTAVKLQLALTEKEGALLVEFLERERRELPAEIHHTRTTTVRERLRERQGTVGGLLERLRGLGEA